MRVGGQDIPRLPQAGLAKLVTGEDHWRSRLDEGCDVQFRLVGAQRTHGIFAGVHPHDVIAQFGLLLWSQLQQLHLRCLPEDELVVFAALHVGVGDDCVAAFATGRGLIGREDPDSLGRADDGSAHRAVLAHVVVVLEFQLIPDQTKVFASRDEAEAHDLADRVVREGRIVPCKITTRLGPFHLLRALLPACRSAGRRPARCLPSEATWTAAVRPLPSR